MQAVTITPERILRKPAVVAMVGLSYTTIWRQYRAGKFPAPVRLSPGAVGWRESDIIGWLSSRQRTITRGE